MSDGTLSVRRRQAKASEPASNPLLDSIRTGTFETFLGGSPFQFIGKPLTKDKGKARAVPVGDAGEMKVEARRRKKLRAYDKLLKNFKYSAALDAVLMKVRIVSDPVSFGIKLTVPPSSSMLVSFVASTAYNRLFAHSRASAP